MRVLWLPTSRSDIVRSTRRPAAFATPTRRSASPLVASTPMITRKGSRLSLPIASVLVGLTFTVSGARFFARPLDRVVGRLNSRAAVRAQS